MWLGDKKHAFYPWFSGTPQSDWTIASLNLSEHLLSKCFLLLNIIMSIKQSHHHYVRYWDRQTWVWYDIILWYDIFMSNIFSFYQFHHKCPNAEVTVFVIYGWGLSELLCSGFDIMYEFSFIINISHSVKRICRFIYKEISRNIHGSKMTVLFSFFGKQKCFFNGIMVDVFSIWLFNSTYDLNSFLEKCML